jgi:hypothetical protein
VHELERVLHREDVAVLGLVDVVDHRRERGRLAAEPVGPVTSTSPRGGELQFLDRGDLHLDQAHHDADAFALVIRRDAESHARIGLPGEVGAAAFFEVPARVGGHDLGEQRVDAFGGDERILDAAHAAVDAQEHGTALHQMDIGCVVRVGAVHEL